MFYADFLLSILATSHAHMFQFYSALSIFVYELSSYFLYTILSNAYPIQL